MGETESISLVFDLIVQLCLGTGQDAKNKVLEFVVDDCWRFMLNGTRQTVSAPTEHQRMGIQAGLASYTVAVWFNGFIAGIFDPYGGAFVAGSLANEDTFIEALKACAAKRGVELKES